MSGTSCTQAGCGGTIAADGYCNTCGSRGGSTLPPPPSAPSPSHATPTAAAAPAGQPAAAGSACTQAGCTGSVAADGYCNTCGLAAARTANPTPAASGAPASTTGRGAPTLAAAVAPSTSARVATSNTGASTRRSASTRQTRAGLGAGLLSVPPTPAGDPAQAVMSPEKIAATLGTVEEEKRFCSSCGTAVGRTTDGRAGRLEGFCSTCRTQFNFFTNAPKLAAGDMVAGQYEILGPIAHGGMGWIYLGRDKAVSDRWVVLKGLLNADDPDAVIAAVAERQFLAQIEHGSIVNIYNFVTWQSAGYIVMEYVGGQSLNGKLKDRRKANNGVPDPLPVDQAIAYILGIIPAFGYLHGLGLVYNDLKPANIMVVDDGVKLIDVGAVMRADDQDAAIFGTKGFQAPEMATAGPSIASDLYTVGRTLAVLVLNFVYHDGAYEFALPTAAEEPLFAQRESLHRFLLKATAAHPDDRFQSADEMASQLTGVLREVVAIGQGTPRPAASSLFGGDHLPGLLADNQANIEAPDWRVLPSPRVNPADPAAAFLQDLPDDDPARRLDLIAQATGTVEPTVELLLARARALIEIGADADGPLTSAGRIDVWDWRVTWFRGLDKLAKGDYRTAAETFSHTWTEVPGEIAPKLAVALAAEYHGTLDRAAQLYEEVMASDPSYVSAAFGLARCRQQSGDTDGAVAAYRLVPTSSASYYDAQLASARVQVGAGTATSTPTPAALQSAASTVTRLQLDPTERANLSAEILERAIASQASGAIGPDDRIELFGEQMTGKDLHDHLETAYREQARLAPTAEARIELAERATQVRRWTLF